MGKILTLLRPTLDRLERLTRTDVRYLLSGGSWLVMGQISIAIIAFLSSLAFAHLVPKGTFGTYRFLLSMFWTLTAFGLTGIPTALARAIAQGKTSAYWTALRFSLLGSLPLALGSFGIAAYYAIQGNYLLVAGAIIIGCIGPGMQASYLYGAVLEGMRAFRTNAFAGIVLNFVPFIGLILLMVINPVAPASAYLAIYLGLSVVSATAISVLTLRVLAPNSDHYDKNEFQSYGIHLSVMNILFTISQQVDKLMVFHVLGAVELAVYTFATAIPDQLRAVFGTLETLSMPRFVNRTIREVLSSLWMRLIGLTIVILLIVIAYIITAPWIFHLLFPAYADSIHLSQLYALSLIPIGSIIPLSLLQAHAAKRELYIFNTVIPLFQIATLAIGLYMGGLVGIIISRIVTRFATLILSSLLVKIYDVRTR